MLFAFIVLLALAAVAALFYFRERPTGSRGKSARELQDEIEAALRWRRSRSYAILKWLRLVR